MRGTLRKKGSGMLREKEGTSSSRRRDVVFSSVRKNEIEEMGCGKRQEC